MLWYVIQTYTGKEEQLVEMVRRIVPGRLYGDCFVAYYEQLRRRQQANQIHIIRAFPGYVFITCDHPEELFFCLKQVPAMSKIVADDNLLFSAAQSGGGGFPGKYYGWEACDASILCIH